MASISPRFLRLQELKHLGLPLFFLLSLKKKKKRQSESETDSQVREQIYGYWRKWWKGGIDWLLATDMYTLLCLQQITNKDLLCSTGNSAQYSAIT